jgi:hypothetical protein
LQKILEAETDGCLGCEKRGSAGGKGGRGRNGRSEKAVLRESREVELKCPRHRKLWAAGGTETPEKSAADRRPDCFGAQFRDVRPWRKSRLEKSCGMEAPPDLISRAAGAADKTKERRSRRLEKSRAI